MTVWSGSGGGPGGGRPDHSPRPGGGRRDGTSPSVPVPHEQPVTSGSLCVTSGSLACGLGQEPLFLRSTATWCSQHLPPWNAPQLHVVSKSLRGPGGKVLSWGKGVFRCWSCGRQTVKAARLVYFTQFLCPLWAWSSLPPPNCSPFPTHPSPFSLCLPSQLKTPPTSHSASKVMEPQTSRTGKDPGER